MTSRSLQSITRPFQKRFREVLGNARILIFYLSTKAWEEKSLPKSHLGWFFLVFGKGKATKENMSIFWFIWPLNDLFRYTSSWYTLRLVKFDRLYQQSQSGSFLSLTKIACGVLYYLDARHFLTCNVFLVFLLLHCM